jgi:hypothetical protein
VAAGERALRGRCGAALAAALLLAAGCAGKAAGPGPTGGSCGNGALDPGEQCDGANLGGQTCASRGLPGTGLACTAGCTFDTSACVAPGSVFPLRISPSKNGLADASGRPFLMQGDAAWSAIAELSEQDAIAYLDARQGQGFNTILVNLVEHQFTDHTPYQRNAAGDLPFTGYTCTPGGGDLYPCYDMSTPSDAYFAHVDWFLDQALSRNMLVLLAPAYMGWGGTQDGWINEMKASGTTKLGIYGQYLGARYQDRPNLIWVDGGDYTPAGAGEMALVTAIIDGVKAAGDTHLHTAHWGGYSSYPGEGYTPHPAWIDIDTIYYTSPPNISNYAVPGWQADQGVRPIFFIEGNYENEHGTTPRQWRSQMYQPLVTGEAGFVMGVGTVWNFWSPGTGGSNGNAYSNDGQYPNGWKTALGSPGAGDAQRAGQLFAALPFATLVPDAGNSAGDAVLGTRAADGSAAVFYSLSLSSFSVSLSPMRGSTTARWFDPSNGSLTAVAGSPFPNSGSHTFTPPGNNSDGSSDWVLLLESP